MNDKILSNIRILFNYRWDTEMTENEETDMECKAQNLIAKYGWKEVFENFFDYLKTECPTPESVANAMCLFLSYSWENNYIPNPYDFLGYIYYRFNLNT